jgi:hypothetical protein
MITLRVAKGGELGNVADSYEKRFLGCKRGGSQKSFFLTPAKTAPESGEKQIYFIA